ncbi:MAG TPA: fdrA domain protein [Clostridiales bacterium]|nr:fdrA domain protein [Clostridiales bacterium]
MKVNELFKQELKVINMGLRSFATDLKSQNVEVVHVDWRPVAGGNKKMASLLSKLKGK